MLGFPRRAVRVVALALAVSLVFAAVAVAASAPVLKSPRNGHKVHAGAIRLVVYDPSVGGSDVYVAIRRHRQLDRYGYLQTGHCNVSKGCYFTTMKRWKGHKGYWIYTASGSFPGWWATTPGKYYWQASIVAPLCEAKGCSLDSAIHSFHVVG